MPVSDSIYFGAEGLPQMEAIIHTSVPDDYLKSGKKYLTGQVFNKVLTYKGKEYSPPRFQIVTVGQDVLTWTPAPAAFRFLCAGKTYQITTDNSRIIIVAGGEPILWRTIVAIQSFDPAPTFVMEADQGVVTTGVAVTKLSYFYKVDGVLVSEPLADGTMFRFLDMNSGSITWRKFAIAGTAGVFEVINNIPTAAIGTYKNVDLSALGNVDDIVAAMDTVDGRAYPIVVVRDGLKRLDVPVLFNGQTNKVENGLYLLSCIDGQPENSSADRISPFMDRAIARIGLSKVVVLAGDRFGQEELWIKSDRPVGATSSQPRVAIGATQHYWERSKSDVNLQNLIEAERQRIDELEAKPSGVGTETDPVALAKLVEVQASLQKAITDIDIPDLTQVNEKLSTLDTTKADKEQLKELNTAVDELAALVELGASDEDLAAATKKVNDSISLIESSVRRLAGNTIFTGAATIKALPGDSVYISGAGDIQLEAVPADGVEIKILDPLKLIKVGKNNVLPGAGDFIGQGQGSVLPKDGTPLSFADNELLGGFLILKYRATAKTWDVFASVSSAAAQSADKVYEAASTSAAPLSHAAIAAVIDKVMADLKKLQSVESVTPPDFDNPHWVTWIQYLYDYSVPSGTVRAWIRTPSNDALAFPNTWSLPVKIPTVADAKVDPNRADLLAVTLPQGVAFRFQPNPLFNSSLSCDVSFPAGVFAGISYQLVDASKAVISRTPRAQSITGTDVAAGLGWGSVPTNAKFAQFTFAYKNGGNVLFEFPITIT
jgi:hypothetical protein